MRRRQFLATSAAGLTLGGFACTATPALALSLETAPPSVAAHLRAAAPSVDGALDWDQLARAGESMFRDGQISRFPADLRALDGKDVALAGYMMPFSDAAEHREFMLGAMKFHCPACMMGDLNKLVAVKAAKPVAQSESPLVIRGRLHLLEDVISPLYYRLEAARPA